MTTIVGRSRMAPTGGARVVSGLVTASAFNVRDSLGSAYDVPLALGNNGGGLLAQSLVYMTASGLPQIRAHFYSRAPSAVPGGDANVVDVDAHLGYVDHTVWVSAGAGLVLSQADYPNLALSNSTGNRSVWVQLEAINDTWGLGGSATPLRHRLGVLQD